MTEKKRKHERLPSIETIFIELVSTSADGHEGEVVRCKTSDISGNGLQAQVGKELILGSILQVGVDLQEAQDTLYLAAQVIWCKPDKNNPSNWSAGVELLNANDSDIKTWRMVLTEMGKLSP
jgi:hypothetical protein